MTHPNSPEVKTKRTRRLSWVVRILFSIVLLVIVTGALMVTTTIGARFTLSLLGHFTGTQMQGVSGSFWHQLTIQRIELRHPEMKLVADGVELQWQPSALLSRHIQLDYARVNNLQLALMSGDETPVTLPASLKLPPLIKSISAEQLAVHHLQLLTLEADQPLGESQQFSALIASAFIDSTKYQLQFSGTTPWGNAALKGGFEPTSPFKTQAQFDLRSVANKQGGILLPATTVHGNLTGSWQELLLQAHVASDATSADKKIEPASGTVHAVIKPFDHLPIGSLQVDLKSVDLSRFHPEAPKGNLQLRADFKMKEDKKSPTKQGQFTIINSSPMTWNSGGIPVLKLSSELSVNEQQLSWRAMKVTLEDGGVMTSSGHLNLAKSVPRERARDTAQNKANFLPDINASVDLKNINLLRIDSRLKNTKLNGTIQTESIKTGLQVALDLQDNAAQNLDAKLTADLQVSHEQLVSLKKLELRAKETLVTAQGSMAMLGKQEFLLQGAARNFNPAHWLHVPEGRIAARFNVAGQIEQGWHIDAKVTELSGQFAGLNLQGESDVVAREGKLLSIKKLEFDWGTNHVSAKGDWQLAELPRVRDKHNQLQFKLSFPDLSALSKPFEKLMADAKQKAASKELIQGSLYADGVLSGNIKQPSGHLNVTADKVALPGVVKLDKLQAKLRLAGSASGKIEGNLDATELIIGASSAGKDGFVINQLQANLSGLRHAHTLNVNAALPRKYQLTLQANGDLLEPRKGGAQWHGLVQHFDLSGPSDLKLASPFTLQIASNAVQMGAASWQGKLGKLQVQRTNWSRGQLKTQGQLQGVPVVNALKLWRSRLPLLGDLQIDAGWDFVISPQQLLGQFDLRRTSGDLILQDVSGGYSQTLALGLQNLSVTGRVGGFTQRAIDVQLQAQGTQLGLIEAQLRSSVNKTAHGWSITDRSSLSGTAKVQSNDIQWLSQLAGPGIILHGELQAQAQLAGTIGNPTYLAQINGKELQVAFTELGVLLPHGILNASIEASTASTQLKLHQLRFSEAIKPPPKHDELTGLTWLKETGYAEASGTIDLRSGLGSITTRWQRFPFLQSPEAWLVATGDAQLVATEKNWNLTGQLIADAAYFSVPKQAPPKLSSDVVVIKKNDRRNVAAANNSESLQSSVDFNIKMGDNFVFVGRGLNTRLTGDVRIRIQNNGPVLATGLIRTVGGSYEGYGQQLAIERGILNFQGALDNPALNVRALRRGLPVEAGVEVVGTVAKPEVRLISEPNVPDQDKLSWMVLGRSSDQASGSDAGLLLTAANAIWGGDNVSNVPRKIAQAFGLDDISLSTSSNAPESQLPSQTVAGSISNSTPTDQIFSVGKRITPDLVFSIERSLTDATSGVKLTWKLTRHFSIIGRTGSDTSVDGQFLFSFD